MKRLLSLIYKYRQKNSELRNLKLWGLGSNKYGHIIVNKISVIDLIKKYGSPLLVVNLEKLKEDSIEIKNALNTVAPDSKVLYSYKTNCIPRILKEIHKLQIGAEVISPYELWLAERLEVPGNMIIYNGVNKTEERIERAIKLNILAINIDNIEEIEKIYQIAKRLNAKVRVGIRLALNKNSQFGLEIENGEAMEALRKINVFSNHLELVCIHFNVASNVKSSWLHKTCALKTIDFLCHIKEKIILKNIEYLDIGGGFGIPTTKNMSKFEYLIYRGCGIPPKPPLIKHFQSTSVFFKELVTSINKFCKERGIKIPKLIIEPGRAITSRSEFLLHTVLAVKSKSNGVRFAITDAGRLSIGFPCEFEYHEIFLANRVEAPINNLYHIMGRVCTSADWLFKNRYLPDLQVGDVLAVMDAGAYFQSFSMNFSYPRPPIVMVSDTEVDIIRQGETFEYLISMDKI